MQNHLQEVFTPHKFQSLLPLLSGPSLCLPNLFAFSTKAITSVTDQTTVRKSPGIKRITGKMFKELPRKSILLLTRIFNSTLRQYFHIMLEKYRRNYVTRI